MPSILIYVILPVSSITPVRRMLFLSPLHMCGNTQRYQMTHAWAHSGRVGGPDPGPGRQPAGAWLFMF